MDNITRIKMCLEKWSRGGETECRSDLVSLHCNLDDRNYTESSDKLATTYQTLLHAVLRTWSLEAESQFGAAKFVAFVQTVLAELPSSSSPSMERPRYLVLFGELLVDLVWAIDSELDEIIADAKAVTSNQGAETEKPEHASESVVKAEGVQKVAESDRETLAEVLKMLLNVGIVDAPTCRERLDSTLLTLTGLIADKLIFERKEIRTRTGLFYKQNKFNLLREQSEGYTKLTTDLIGSLGPPNLPSSGLPVESYQAVKSRAEAVWERVVSLIGYFDLDPNRALDIILDVFSVNIATHWQFFLALLACSPWVGENKNVSDWEKGVDTVVDHQPDQYRGKSLDEILLLAENNAKGSNDSALPSTQPKTKVLAQVLGFKFTHYQSSETKASCPRGLYLVAALLIREEFITLEDLYPHLSPSEEEMPKLHGKYLDDVQSRIKSSSNNLLAMAAPLESSSLGSSTKSKTPNPEAKTPAEVKEPPAQKAMLLVALLSAGVLRPAIALMTRYPWLIDTHRELADLLLRVLKASISPLFDKLFTKERNKGFLQPRSRYAAPGVRIAPARRPQLTLCAPTPPSTHTQDFVFFFPQWSEWVPVCESADDIIDIVEPLMRFVGIHVSREPLFLTKLLRIGRSHLAQSLTPDLENKDGKRSVTPITEPENSVQEFWLKTARRYLLPALSMMPGNAVCTVEVWNILRFYDLTVRWRLYGEWRDQTYKSHPELNAQRVLREREAKGILRRLSSQTVESLAGSVAKMAHTNPCIFFTNAVNQIQAYDNLADVVIQALRFATNMGFDVLVFLVIDALGNPHKDRMKEDGANAADWLQSLATFSGALFRRYSTDSSSVLKYIVHQLYNGQTSEIVVLEKLILRMAGIEPLPSLSNAQITAMAGGPTLRIETVASDLRGAGLDVSEVLTKGPQRLGKTLIDTKLAFPILVQVEQQRQACVFKARDAHLKSIAYLFDATHGVLLQYIDLLTTPDIISPEDYRKIMPSLSELVNLYGVSPPIAMQIYRPMLNDAIAGHARAWCSAEATEKRLKAALAAKREPTSNSTVPVENASTEIAPLPEVKPDPNSSAESEKMELDTVEQKPGENGENKEELTAEVKAEEKPAPAPEEPWVPEIRALFDDCKQVAPGNTFDIIGPSFYITFWQMSSYDLYYPKEKYAEVEKNLRATSDAMYSKARQAERSSDRSTRASSGSLRVQYDRYLATISKLRQEKAAQESVYRYTTEKGGRLDREKDHWFSHVGAGAGKGATFIQSLIEHCIQPRCLLSPMDAVYCARLIRTLHERGTPGFHTLMCYDKLLGEHVKVVIFSCSENEARNYGRFLKGILQDLYEWHKDQKAYEASNYRKDGADVVLLPGLQTHWSKDGPSSRDDLLKWPGFRSFLKKCHRKLGQCFTECIQAGDFMHVYNAVLVLKEIIDVFPIAAVNEVVGSSIDLEIQRLVQSEERGDLKILARAYSSSLKKREKIWTMPKVAQPIKPVPSRPASSPSIGQPEKPRDSPAPIPPTGPRASQPSLPAAPEKAPPIERPSSAAKLALEGIPRPEVVKRNRDSRPPETSSADTSKKVEPMHVDQQLNGKDGPIVKASTPAADSQRGRDEIHSPHPTVPPRPAGRLLAASSSTDLRKEVLQGTNVSSRPGTPMSSSQAPVTQNGLKDSPQSSPRYRDRDSGSPMAPPAEPSQTVHAQELRNLRRGEKLPQSPREQRADAVDSPARRSLSPASRPGTRNASADSRASGDAKRDRARHDTEGEDSKRSAVPEPPSRAERNSGTHRDGHSRSERSGRDRIPGSSTRDADRERDSDRERVRDRRDREKSHRSERESHRERDRERDRDRSDRDKDRERHRREERERERERKAVAAKEPEIPSENTLPSRSDGSRHRTHTDSSQADVTLGKRRRTPDDESERSAKRSSRQREERSRKTSEKDASRDPNRESDRRRKERDAQENDTHVKSTATEKPSDRVRENEPSSVSTPAKASAPPPSAPRAILLGSAQTRLGGRGDTSPAINREKEQDRDRGARDRPERSGRGERMHADRDVWVDKPERTEMSERDDREREKTDRGQRVDKTEREWKEGPGRATQNGSAPPTSLGSLRDRISNAPGTPQPSASSSGRGGVGGTSNREEHGDSLKRSITERDRDILADTSLSGSNAMPAPSKDSSKRVRIDRSRFRGDSGSGPAKRTVRQ